MTWNELNVSGQTFSNGIAGACYVQRARFVTGNAVCTISEGTVEWHKLMAPRRITLSGNRSTYEHLVADNSQQLFCSARIFFPAEWKTAAGRDDGFSAGRICIGADDAVRYVSRMEWLSYRRPWQPALVSAILRHVSPDDVGETLWCLNVAGSGTLQSSVRVLWPCAFLDNFPASPALLCLLQFASLQPHKGIPFIPFGSLISLVHLSTPLCPQAPTLNLPSTCLMVCWLCSILGSRPISFPSLFLLSSPSHTDWLRGKWIGTC